MLLSLQTDDSPFVVVDVEESPTEGDGTGDTGRWYRPRCARPKCTHKSSNRISHASVKRSIKVLILRTFFGNKPTITTSRDEKFLWKKRVKSLRIIGSPVFLTKQICGLSKI